MPGRSGELTSIGWAGTGGSIVQANLFVDSRSGNVPLEYKAFELVEFREGFESGNNDDFLAFLEEGGSDTSGANSDDGESNKGIYRYGFNGKEKFNEVYGEGNIYDYGFRIYNPRIGKFLSVDPLSAHYPWNSTYSFAENDVVRCIDLDGLEKYYVTNYWKKGVKQRTEIEAYKDVDTKETINMQFKLGQAPLTEKDVVIYDVYDEGTKEERILQSDAKQLDPEQAEIYRNASRERISGPKVKIENMNDEDCDPSFVNAPNGLIKRFAFKNYNGISSTGKSLDKKVNLLAPGASTTIEIMSHDMFGDGKIHGSGSTVVENGTIHLNLSPGLQSVIEGIKKNGGVPNVTITGFYWYTQEVNKNKEDVKTANQGIENLKKNFEKLFKEAGAKSVNVNIQTGVDDNNMGLRELKATY